MGTTENFIDGVIHELGDLYTEEEKSQCADIIKNVLEEEETPLRPVEINPKMLNLIYDHAYKLYNSGNYFPANLLFSFLVLLQPASAKYAMGLAATYHMMKEYGKAAESYLACYYLDMTNPLPFYHMADCCLKEKDIENAHVSLDVAIALAKANTKYAKLQERAELMRNRLLVEEERAPELE